MPALPHLSHLIKLLDDESEVVRLAPGDDGYPPRLDALCVHLGGTYDPNQASLFDEAEATP